jgi:YidC/Oxa1 family membrane protein insertase
MFGDSDNKNLILAAVLSIGVVFAWQAFFVPPPPPPVDPAVVEGQSGTVPAATTDGSPATAGAAAPIEQTRGEALASATRVSIDTEALSGSVALTGGRLDDLHLSQYRKTLEDDADTVVLLNPAGAPAPYFIDYGWRRTVDGDPGPLPNPATEWSIDSGQKLTTETPVVLRWENGQGLIFHRKFEIDDRYMFTVTQSVENTTDNAVSLAPYGAIARRGEPDGVGFYILHEGAVGVFDGELVERDYDEIRESEVSVAERGPAETTSITENGWLGFTDKYWLTSLTPESGQSFDAVYRMLNLGGVEEFRAEMRLPVISIAAGATVESVSNLFAGAKEFYTLTSYEDALGIVDFHKAIDWGWFYFLTKPIFKLLNWVHSLIGNMGISIIVLTLLVKACLFPLAYKSYVSMSKMKKLQPEMEKIKERVGDDKQKMQQEMMALYKKEKVNPAAGCLPIVLQIPIFFSLYKVLFVTIEMRHAPFLGWIHDLSAPDPTSLLNLFGLIPYEIPAFLMIFSIGVYPIVMGITMWMQQKLNPAPTDPTQKMIFAWMPWVFMFMLGRFASGLVIYWCANNIITFTQQYLIMRSQGVEVNILGNITSGFKRKMVVATDKPPSKAEIAKAAEPDTEADDTATGEDTPQDDKPAKKPGKKTSSKPESKPGTKPRRKRKGGGD